MTHSQHREGQHSDAVSTSLHKGLKAHYTVERTITAILHTEEGRRDTIRIEFRQAEQRCCIASNNFCTEFVYSFSVEQQPNSCLRRLNVEVSRSHTHTLQDYERVEEPVAEAATYTTHTKKQFVCTFVKLRKSPPVKCSILFKFDVTGLNSVSAPAATPKGYVPVYK